MADDTATDREWADLRRSGKLFSFWVLCLGVWLHAADSLLVATAMPKAVAEIGGDALVSWTLTLYLLGSILSGAGAALGATAFGLRRAFVFAAAIYAAGCAASGLAPDMIVMLAGRLVQGIGGGWLVALTYVAIQRLYPERHWPRLIGIMSAVWGVSAFCGPLIGGFFADNGLWRWSFWAFAIQAVALCVLVPIALPHELSATRDAPRFPGLRLSILCLAVLLVSIAGLTGSPYRALALCALAAIAFALFLAFDATKGAQRMFPSRVADPRGELGAGFIVNLALGSAAMSMTVYGPFLLATLYGLSALGAGYVIALESVAWSIAAVAVAGVRPAGEIRLIRAGALMVAGAVAGLAWVMPGGPLWLIVVLAVIQGAGFGMLWGFVVRRAVAAAPAGERDATSSAMPTTQQIAFALGAALCGIVANLSGFDRGISAATAPKVAFWIFAAFIPVALAGVAAAFRFRDEPMAPKRG